MSLRTFFYDTYVEMSADALLILYVLWTWHSDASHAVGFALSIAAFALWIKARRDLGAAFSILPQAQQLVTSGIYAKIRHPIYLFSTLVFLGIVIALEQPMLYIAPALLALAQTYRMRKEDLLLETTHGEAYAAYKKGTWF